MHPQDALDVRKSPERDDYRAFHDRMTTSLEACRGDIQRAPHHRVADATACASLPLAEHQQVRRSNTKTTLGHWWVTRASAWSMGSN